MTGVQTCALPILTHYVEGDPFPAASHESALDIAVMREQQLKDLQNQALHLPTAVRDTVSRELPLPVANTALVWNAGGTALTNVPVVGQEIPAYLVSQMHYELGYETAVPRILSDKLGEYVSVKDFGATGDGATDDTTAIQNAIDYAYENPVRVNFPAGVYLVTGLYVYGIIEQNLTDIIGGNATHLYFEPGAMLRMSSENGHVIRVARSPGVILPEENGRAAMYGRIENAIIDMDFNGYTGILLECAHQWRVTNVEIRNVPAGEFVPDDNHGTTGLLTGFNKSGIMIKGIYYGLEDPTESESEDNPMLVGGTGAYSNIIENCHVIGDKTLRESGGGGAGVTFCTSLNRNSRKANFNTVNGGTFDFLKTGIDVISGSNNNLYFNNIFNCGTGIRISTPRNYIFKPYVEGCSSNGIEIVKGSFNQIVGLSSVAATAKAGYSGITNHNPNKKGKDGTMGKFTKRI